MPSSCADSVLHSSNAITDLGGSAANNGVASLGWRFELPDVFAFSFTYVSGGVMAVNLVEPPIVVDSIDTTTASGFIGLVSDTPLFGAIAVNRVFPQNIGNDRYFIDDFRINERAAVPAPVGVLLFGLALAVLVVRRRAAGTRAL